MPVRQSPARPIHHRQGPDDEFPHQGRWKPRSGAPEGIFDPSAQSVGEAISQGRLGRAAPPQKVPKATGDVVAGKVTGETMVLLYYGSGLRNG